MTQKKEFYANQQARFRNCDWDVFLTIEKIKALEKGTTNKGRYMAFYFEKEPKSHGFDNYHRAFSEAYIDAMIVMHANGLTGRDWAIIKYGRNPAPIAQTEMSNDRLSYSQYPMN